MSTYRGHQSQCIEQATRIGPAESLINNQGHPRQHCASVHRLSPPGGTRHILCPHTEPGRALAARDTQALGAPHSISQHGKAALASGGQRPSRKMSGACQANNPQPDLGVGVD